MTVSASRGSSTVMSLRLCSRAPATTIEAWGDIRPHEVYVAPGRQRRTPVRLLANCGRRAAAGGRRPFPASVLPGEPGVGVDVVHAAGEPALEREAKLHAA